MHAIIFNSALSFLFKNETPLIPGALIYDPEQNTVWHRQKYPSGEAFAKAYKYDDYLGRSVDLLFRPDGTGRIYLIDGDQIINEIPVEHLWNDEQNTPDLISLYGIAHMITSYLDAPEVIRIHQNRLDDIFSELHRMAMMPAYIPGNDRIEYGEIYKDDEGFKYRIVTVPPKTYDEILHRFGNRTLSEMESRSVGISQSPGWVHIFSNPKSRALIYRRNM